MTADAVERSIIIVNWNAGAALAACLDSVADEAHSGQQVIVVDNASTDDSIAQATRTRPWVQVVQHDDNRGFAAGANAGAAHARGTVLVFLNPDAVATPGAIAGLAEVVAPGGVAALAGGGLEHLDGSWQPGAARFEPVTHLLLDTTLGRWRARGRQTAYAVDWVYGTFLAVRADVFRALDGFDTRYFCYGEDLDLCYRAQRAGHRVWHVPARVARHGQNVSAVQRFGTGRDAEAVKGELRFYAWRWGPAAVARYRWIAGAKYRLKAVWLALRGRAAEAAACQSLIATCRDFRAAP